MSGDYIVFMHSDRLRDYLRPLSARELYKLKSHDERYQRRYGEYPKVYKAESGHIEGFRFIIRNQS